MESVSAAPDTDWVAVPCGNTQRHVNRDVLKYLLNQLPGRLDRPGLRWAGSTRPVAQESFQGRYDGFYPLRSSLWGADVRSTPPAAPDLAAYAALDLGHEFPFEEQADFDVITSISGIMCCANTAQFIKRCARHLRPGGLLLVSNDNCLTVHDWPLYLFTGRVRCSRLLFEPDEGNFQLVQHQELKRLFDIIYIRLVRVCYTSRYPEDLLQLPLALLLWPWQWWQLRRLRNHASQELRQQLFELRSLLYRHYFFVGEKLAAG